MKIFFPLLFCFLFFHLKAQEIPALGSGYSISFETNYTFKNEITSVPQGTDGVDLFSRGQLGYEVDLSYLLNVRKALSLNGSVVGGIYPVSTKYYLKREYIGGLSDLNTAPSPTDYYSYMGVNIGLNKFFNIKDNLYSIGGNIGVIYFANYRRSWELYSSRDGNIDPSFLVFQKVFISDRVGSFTIAPELTLSHYKKLNKKLWLYFYLTGTYSSARPIKGVYEIFGENETIRGEIKKRYTHIGLGAGLFFSKIKK